MLFDIYFPRLKVLAVPYVPTRRDTWYFFDTYWLGIISGSHKNAIFFIEGSASAICLKSLSQLAYLPIACTDNDRPRQQNPTASIAKLIRCRSRSLAAAVARSRIPGI